MNSIQSLVRLKIHSGKLNEFKELSEQCLTSTSQKDKNTLQYDWYFNDEGTECVIFEKYKDSNAVFEHLGNLGDLLGKLLQISDLSVEVFGNPSEELRTATADMKPKIYLYFQGL